jgi:hypothetical protein
MMSNISQLMSRVRCKTKLDDKAEFDGIDVVGIFFALILLIAALWLFSWGHSMMTSHDTTEKILGIFAGPGLIALGVTLLGGMVAIIVALIRRH